MRMITDSTGARVIALACYKDSERLDGFDVAIVRPSARLLALCEARGAVVAGISDERLVSVEFWVYHYAPEYYEGNYAEADDPPDPVWDRGDYRHRTECDRMVVDRDGVSWACYAKHTDVPVTTEAVTYAELRAVVAELSAKIGG